MIELLLQAERALSMGLVDQADHLYRQAADADPRNSIAVVGLARVALERGDDILAWREAKRALSIDRENAAAQRMVARFEEVWRHRGQAIPGAAGDTVGAAVRPAVAEVSEAEKRAPEGEDRAAEPFVRAPESGPALAPVEASQAWARITGEARGLTVSAVAPVDTYGWPESDLRPDAGLPPDAALPPDADLRPDAGLPADAATEPWDAEGRAADDGFPVAEDEAYDALAAETSETRDGGPGAWPPPDQEPPALHGLDRVRHLFGRRRE